MRHKQPSPFPMTLKDGSKACDELCVCGHYRSDHHDRGPAYGHGRCSIGDGDREYTERACCCPRFFWTAFDFIPGDEGTGEYERLKAQKNATTSKERMLDIAVALKQIDPFNRISRLRDFNKETDPSRVAVEELNKIIVRLR